MLLSLFMCVHAREWEAFLSQTHMQADFLHLSHSHSKWFINLNLKIGLRM